MIFPQAQPHLELIVTFHKIKKTQKKKNEKRFNRRDRREVERAKRPSPPIANECIRIIQQTMFRLGDKGGLSSLFQKKILFII